MSKENDWKGVDLDGTLALYERGDYNKFGSTSIGAPIPKMIARVKKWLANGERVKIVTARISEVGEDGKDIEAIHEAIQLWCAEHIGCVLPVTCEKDGFMTELWDDRAVQIISNTGERADGTDMFFDEDINAVLTLASETVLDTSAHEDDRAAGAIMLVFGQKLAQLKIENAELKRQITAFTNHLEKTNFE